MIVINPQLQLCLLFFSNLSAAIRSRRCSVCDRMSFSSYILRATNLNLYQIGVAPLELIDFKLVLLSFLTPWGVGNYKRLNELAPAF